MGVFNKKKKDEAHLDGTLASYPYLCDIKPNERYVFIVITMKLMTDLQPFFRSFMLGERMMISDRSGA